MHGARPVPAESRFGELLGYPLLTSDAPGAVVQSNPDVRKPAHELMLTFAAFGDTGYC